MLTSFQLCERKSYTSWMALEWVCDQEIFIFSFETIYQILSIVWKIYREDWKFDSGKVWNFEMDNV